MNWTTILTGEARQNCILQSDELARRYRLSEAVVGNALRRYEARGLVERVSTKIYIIHVNRQSHHVTWSTCSVRSLTSLLSQHS